MQYKTGDHLGVFAENGKDVTKRVAKALKLDVDEVFRLVKPSGAPASLAEPFATPMTVGDAIARYADVLTPPRKQALAALASVASGKDAEKLAFLASPAGKDEFAQVHNEAPQIAFGGDGGLLQRCSRYWIILWRRCASFSGSILQHQLKSGG